MLDTRRIIPDITPIDLDWVRDASLKAIGVLIGGKKWAQFALIKGLNLGLSNGVVQNIAWAETVTILLGLIIISQRHNVGGKHYIVLTGNTMSQSVVGKRQSRDQAVNMEWKAIQRPLLKLQADVVAHQVKLGHNMAALLSRVLDNRAVDDMIVIKIPTDLRPFVVQVLWNSIPLWYVPYTVWHCWGAGRDPTGKISTVGNYSSCLLRHFGSWPLHISNLLAWPF